MPIIQPAVALSTRQEAFCRHYAASGNATYAARRAGHAELHDPRSPETVERRRRGSLNRLERTGPFNPPGDATSAPDHDKT